ncbi:hypothetical protein [Mycobacterium asiaticum]|uniref:WXG100 family type VII secretion target n=1 Tax=Mycobacterium asiaticum TaxID=1790 RepID=A0A1A3NDF1_MYCAS|nr:hypothetical protein [Mycobacterium asiaticum]OBK18447.1 hypothetical protein A5636_20765 [Mycobacterium asiaticum]
MAGQFEYEDGTARAGIGKFDGLAHELGSLVNSLKADLAGDSPWSHDKIGSQFAAKFDPDRSTVIGHTDDFKKAVDSVAPVLTGTADAIVAQDGG